MISLGSTDELMHSRQTSFSRHAASSASHAVDVVDVELGLVDEDVVDIDLGLVDDDVVDVELGLVDVEVVVVDDGATVGDAAVNVVGEGAGVNISVPS